jgi:hypothetical protein
MNRLILLGFVLAMAPAVASAESDMDKFNAGLKPILTQSEQVQMALSCRLLPGTIAQGAALKMSTELNALIAQVWGIDPNGILVGEPKQAWTMGMQRAEAAGSTALNPTKDECQAFQMHGGVAAVQAVFGSGD